jgi:hypothetical protein
MSEQLQHINVLPMLMYCSLKTVARFGMPENKSAGAFILYTKNNPAVTANILWMNNGVRQMSASNSPEDCPPDNCTGTIHVQHKSNKKTIILNL